MFFELYIQLATFFPRCLKCMKQKEILKLVDFFFVSHRNENNASATFGTEAKFE